MVGMTDIALFLATRLDEDEAAAVRAARPEPWVKPQPSRPDWYVQFWADEQDRAAVVADPESLAYPVVVTLGYDGNDEADEELAEGRVEHIARHDPARVLAEVAAKRAIVAMHEQAEKLVWDPRPAGTPVREPRREPAGYCSTCQVEDGVIHGTWPCDTLKHLATVYSEHPDFNPAWGIDG